MNALWRAEAKSNRALAGIRGIGTWSLHLAQQGLLAPGAPVFHAEDVNLPRPNAAGHVGIFGVGRQATSR